MVYYVALYECTHVFEDDDKHFCPYEFKVAKCRSLNVAVATYQNMLRAIANTILYNGTFDVILDFIREEKTTGYILMVDSLLMDYVYTYHIGPYSFIITKYSPEERSDLFAKDAVKSWTIVADHSECTNDTCNHLSKEVDELLADIFPE